MAKNLPKLENVVELPAGMEVVGVRVMPRVLDVRTVVTFREVGRTLVFRLSEVSAIEVRAQRSSVMFVGGSVEVPEAVAVAVGQALGWLEVPAPEEAE